jgi:hypothetical protein
MLGMSRVLLPEDYQMSADADFHKDYCMEIKKRKEKKNLLNHLESLHRLHLTQEHVHSPFPINLNDT